MVKPAFILKRTHNAMLDLLVGWDLSQPLASENALALRLDVSRTTIRGALRTIGEAGLLVSTDQGIMVRRRPQLADFFHDTQTIGPREIVERTFLRQILRGDWQPGAELSETDLARDSGCSIASVREFLIGFSRFHLVEKRARGGWRMLGFHAGFANEVADMRWLIETAAICAFPQEPDQAWLERVRDMLVRHRRLHREIKRRYLEFPDLDREFHLWIAGHLHNRFANDFFDVVSLVFHYHYQWNRIDERERNTVALVEHIGVLEALSECNMDLAGQRLQDHLVTSRRSLIRSLPAGGDGPGDTPCER